MIFTRTEAFIVCQGYAPPPGFEPNQLTRILEQRAISHAGSNDDETVGTKTWPNDVLVPFLACGDLSGYDADQSYALDDVDFRLKPVQAPIMPAYKSAMELLKKK